LPNNFYHENTNPGKRETEENSIIEVLGTYADLKIRRSAVSFKSNQRQTSIAIDNHTEIIYIFSFL
jgi:hypothetical protein